MSRKPVSAWWKAQELLARRAHGRRELLDKLRQRGYDESEIAETEKKLLAAGWLDDAAFAGLLIAELFYRRGYGPYAIRARLRQKGLESELCDEASAAFFAALKPGELDEVLAALWRRRQGQEPEKVAAWLQRRGFAGDDIRRLLEKLDGNARA